MKDSTERLLAMIKTLNGVVSELAKLANESETKPRKYPGDANSNPNDLPETISLD